MGFLLASCDLLGGTCPPRYRMSGCGTQNGSVFWVAGEAWFDWLEGCELLNGAEEVDSADDAWLVAGTINEEEDAESE